MTGIEPGVQPDLRTPAVAQPELAVAPRVLVVSLGARRPVAALVEQWLDLDPGLRAHRAQLAELLRPTARPRVGEVAAFLSYAAVAGELVGGAAVLSLELVGTFPGSPVQRAADLARVLRDTAEAAGQIEGLTQVERRWTTSGVAAARVRFLGLAGPQLLAGEPRDSAPLVEVCRWLYPVPEYPDLLWVLVFQTTDLDHADALLAEFDRMAGSLTWVEP